MAGITILEPEAATRAYLAPRWHVVLLDDNAHTYDYVVEMLVRLFGYTPGTALSLAEEVDFTGRSVVWTSSREQAEFKQEQIHSYGADHRIAACQGSMSAVLEPAD